jgi:hypothetical protein
MNTVALLRAESGTSPSGTGSFSYFANFTVLVSNLAFDKIVQVLTHDPISNAWTFHPCTFSTSVPGNGELWTLHLGSPPVDQFVIQFQVLGNTFWDNNSGFNYLLDIHASQSTDGVGSAYVNTSVQEVASAADAGGNLEVDILVQNLAFAKQTGIVYTTNNWATSQVAFAGFQQGFAPLGSPHQVNAELWIVKINVGAGQSGQFAVFYGVNGSTFWDNNFGRNYSF